MRRRQFIRGIAGAGVASAALASEAVATHDSTGKPAHVTLSFDEAELATYQPKLVTGHLEVRPTKQYAWLATSSEHDTDVYTYWTYYVTQRGLLTQDSHILDREPVYVFVDEAGDVTEVIYSAYHWLAESTTSPETVVDSTGEHPTLRIAEKWHHYLETTDDSGVFEDLASMDDVFDDWLANGWEDDLVIGGAQNPWIMRRRDSWFADDAGGAYNQLIRSIWLRVSKLPGVSIRGGANTDL